MGNRQVHARENLQGQSLISGFTLFELIVSLSIVSILLVLIFGALRLGVRAWERGERDLVADQQARVVLEMVRHQIASFQVVDQKTENLEKDLLLAGTETSMKFYSSVALAPGDSYGPVFVRYVVQAEDDFQILYLYEKNAVMLTEEEKKSDTVDLDALIPLMTKMTRISFDYLKKDDALGIIEWQPAWNPDEETGLPVAVRISVVDPRSESPISTAARIRIDYE